MMFVALLGVDIHTGQAKKLVRDIFQCGYKIRLIPHRTLGIRI